MTESAPSATFTTEFGQEFEAERERWLRRRFLWYTGVVGGLRVISLIGMVLAILIPGLDDGKFREGSASILTWMFVLTTLSAAIYLGAFWRVFRDPGSGGQVLRVAFWLIVSGGIIHLGLAYLGDQLAREIGATGAPGQRTLSLDLAEIGRAHV